MKADHLIQRLGLKRLPGEGGYYKETYRSDQTAGNDRDLSTAIYYLITPEASSKMHRVSSDEIFHFYFGDPVQMLLLYPTGESRVVVLGDNLPSGQKPSLSFRREPGRAPWLLREIADTLLWELQWLQVSSLTTSSSALWRVCCCDFPSMKC